MTIGELIERLGGELLQGNAATRLLGVQEVAAARAGDLVFGEDAAAVARAVGSAASAAVVPMGSVVADGAIAVIATKQPRLWFAKAARLLLVPEAASGVHPAAVVSPDAVLGDGISIGAGAVVGLRVSIGARSRVEAGAVIGDGVTIGSDCRIYPRAVLYARTVVGDRVIVHAGAVLGADGFGYVRDRGTGAYTQFPQQGGLVIEDDVEIGANTTIDRGALAETRIRRGVKLDNLVHIGHNCDIGEDVVIASQTGISGSSTVGKGAILAGQVGIGDHAHVGAGVILGGQAGVLSGKTLETTGTVLWGTPAKPLREYLRELATLGRLARRKRE
ncbi:UDP-3-O-(3-hydroxymyristoyl)glucosamine N-acyltransferase [Acidicapsa ligni]|uniref:UDP-3-O-(3-hydroxymyristoyl)glucosamine N-acyltransferase n=1 Tax=Acidicapsa ligni TaxID=542300 RepID=UPI0021DFB2EF|nr:UDP-3-O-(3-hydroxymyristoyl)glucosamine N-acyltransferase [Acidicapsa ligni]